MKTTKIILIGGPTASGKSALAMKIARETASGGTIINADAMQVYAGLPLLTAQPSVEDKAEIRHLLYEVTDPAEASSAGKWLALARATIAEVQAQGRMPILVGGTGLYFEALCGGLADIPPIPDEVRCEVSDLYDALGEEKFRAGLAALDGESASRIERNDRQRLIRAYEVATHTGKALGDWYSASAGDENDGTEYERHLLMPDRAHLYAQCDRRFEMMMERGAIEEVRALMARNLSPDLPAMKILGVREIAAYLNGETTLPAAISKTQQMTRNYAKRQMTWFRNRWDMVKVG
jgi:tRNA dimethylallyltransferase